MILSYGGIMYELCNNTTAKVYGLENYHDENLVIPEHIIYKKLKYVITEIGDNALKNSKIKSISLPWCLDTIGKYAFMNSTVEVVGRESHKTKLPVKLTIEQCAFLECSRLHTVYFKGPILLNGDSCFADCITLKYWSTNDIIGRIPENTFQNCVSLKKFCFMNGIEVLDNAFENVNLLTAKVYNPVFNRYLLTLLKNVKIETPNLGKLNELVYLGYDVSPL